MPDLTKLKPGQEVAYNKWKSDNKINESDDYDMKGYWKEKGFQNPIHDGHFPDTYKLKSPFSEGDRYQQISDESKYSGNPGYLTGNNTSFDKRGQGTWNEDNFMGYKHGTKSIKMKTYKSKYKKAANGLQSVAVPQQGSTSNVMSSATSMAAAGAQFGPWGAVAGGALGLATGMYQKDEQDKANKLAMNKNKYLSANRAVDGVDDSVDQKTQVFKGGGNVVVNGKPKYRRADGKVVKRGLWSNTYLSKKEDGMSTMKEGTKMIEIEGKGTPEIHTDKNFNVKNLGTTPHTKGGNKVEASEGDVVFNTQNSLAKYNKIATAIQSGDKATLIKEKNRLPDDGGTKNQTGNKGVKPKKTVKPAATPFSMGNYVNPATNTPTFKRAPTGVAGAISGIDREATNTFSRLAAINDNRPNQTIDRKGDNVPDATPVTPYNGKAPIAIPGLGTVKGSYKPPVEVAKAKSTNVAAPARSKAAGKQGKKISTQSTPAATTEPTIDKSFLTSTAKIGDGSDLRGQYEDNQFAGPPKPADSVYNPPVTPSSDKPNTPPPAAPKSNTASNIAQFAGVANNLYQGLKTEKPINEQYFDPQLNKYTDRSESMRQASTSAMNIQNSNARNVSGGNAGNMRANQNQAALGNLTRQDAINEQEMTRRDAVENSNIGVKNAAGQLNLQRKDMYQGQIDGGRSAKEAFIGQAASDIGKYGQLKNQETYLRSRDDKLAASDLAGYTAMSGGQHYRNLDGTAGFNALGTTGGGYIGGRSGQRTSQSGIGLNGFYPDAYNKDGSIIEKAKGVKAVKVKSKYKMK